MTALTDHFEVTHSKDGFTYVSWSQVADRLDAAEPGWSFAVVAIGDDWAHGRLTFKDGRSFENIGYAENAEATWKKEVLKDAASDAFKRCAALAGVARYLYDKDAPTTHAARGVSSAPTAIHPRPVTPPPAGGSAPEEPDYVREALAAGQERPMTAAQHEERTEGAFCPQHGLAWSLRPGGVSKTTGKAYDPFYACPSPDRPYCKEKPSRKWLALQEMAS